MGQVISQEALGDRVRLLQREGKVVVFTNGCFDLLHIGHVRYLKAARNLGDCLVVAINSDSSIRQLKGVQRPIIPQEERAEILAALSSVDYVTIFDQLDPGRLISLLRPQVLVKGGDWSTDRIVGKQEVEAAGGRVLSLPLVEGAGSSQIIDSILKKYAESPRNSREDPRSS